MFLSHETSTGSGANVIRASIRKAISPEATRSKSQAVAHLGRKNTLRAMNRPGQCQYRLGGKELQRAPIKSESSERQRDEHLLSGWYDSDMLTFEFALSRSSPRVTGFDRA